MPEQTPPGDPFEFLKTMWGPMGNSLPGMVTPTLDVNEIDKRIAELRSVETWLGMNLNMLKMTVQGLEMQRATLTAFQAMANPAKSPEAPVNSAPAAQANVAPWPWNLMPQAASPPAPAEKQPKKGESDAKQ
jgi:hypothetical protein